MTCAPFESIFAPTSTIFLPSTSTSPGASVWPETVWTVAPRKRSRSAWRGREQKTSSTRNRYGKRGDECLMVLGIGATAKVFESGRGLPQSKTLREIRQALEYG